MILTNEQEQALKIILEKYRRHEKYVTVCGYAGVGKSTLVKFAIEALDVAEDKVAYACFCGKAAEVLRRKGNKNAMTLHKLLYDSIPRRGGGFFRKPKIKLEYDIVVVDEVSLAPKSMLDMLLKHKVFCIFIGDSFQLPQIDKNEAHTFLNNPDIFLSTVMRQAAESEIIQLTMKIREGQPINYFQGKEVQVLPYNQLNTGMLLWADQILTATNNKRHNINQQMRKLLGFNNLLCEKEKIVVKRNYWDDCNEDGDALVNGMVGTINNLYDSFIKIPPNIKTTNHVIPTICGNITPEFGASFQNINIDKNFLIYEEPCVDWRISYQVGKMKNKIGDILPKHITYGYALTCHAAQGSEWDKVLVLEESFPFDKIEHSRWVYTACTMDSEKLVLVR